MGKQHQTMPNEPEEAPLRPKGPEIQQPADPPQTQSPPEAPQTEPKEIPDLEKPENNNKKD